MQEPPETVMSNRRDHPVSIRFKPEEYAQLVAKAGTTPISTFVRRFVLDEVASRRSGWKAAPVKDQAALAKVLALLGQDSRVQAFKRSAQQIDDGTADCDGDTRQQIAACHAMLADILSLLMRALGAGKR